MRGSRAAFMVAGSYLALYVLTIVYALCALVFDTVHSEFAGIFEILVTLPWSLVLSPVETKMGLIDFGNSFAAHPLLFGLVTSIYSLPGALLNAAALYFIAKNVASGPKKDRA